MAQTSKQAYMCVQCSFASVGLTQVCLNYTSFILILAASQLAPTLMEKCCLLPTEIRNVFANVSTECFNHHKEILDIVHTVHELKHSVKICILGNREPFFLFQLHFSIYLDVSLLWLLLKCNHSPQQDYPQLQPAFSRKENHVSGSYNPSATI